MDHSTATTFEILWTCDDQPGYGCVRLVQEYGGSKPPLNLDC